MNINPVFTNLTQKQQQLMRLMKEHSLDFPKRALYLFSMSQFMINRLLDPIKPSTRNNSNERERLRHEFLKRCLMKFRLSLTSQFIFRGRSNPINHQDIIRLNKEKSLEKQFLSISHYGTAILLGNTSAIAEIIYRLFKIKIYSQDGFLAYSIYQKFLDLLEYGTSRRCPDCLAIKAHFLNVGFYSIIQRKNQRAVKLAGESVEAGSVIGCLFFVGLLSNSHFDAKQDIFSHQNDINEIEDAIKILQEKIRKKKEGVLICINHVAYTDDLIYNQIIIAIRVLQNKLILLKIK